MEEGGEGRGQRERGWMRKKTRGEEGPRGRKWAKGGSGRSGGGAGVMEANATEGWGERGERKVEGKDGGRERVCEGMRRKGMKKWKWIGGDEKGGNKYGEVDEERRGKSGAIEGDGWGARGEN